MAKALDYRIGDPIVYRGISATVTGYYFMGDKSYPYAIRLYDGIEVGAFGDELSPDSVPSEETK